MTGGLQDGIAPHALDVAELVRAYARVAPSTIGHLADCRLMSPSIRPLEPGMRVVGPAVTVSLPGRDSTTCYRAFDHVRPGDVLVIDRAGDRRYSCWGEMMTLAAKMRRLGGVVVDGPLTDLSAVRALGIPVFGRGSSALTTQILRTGTGDINLPISCGGVAVAPGELILGDEDGVLVLSPVEAIELLQRAVKEEADDAAFRDALLAGRTPSELVDLGCEEP